MKIKWARAIYLVINLRLVWCIAYVRIKNDFCLHVVNIVINSLQGPCNVMRQLRSECACHLFSDKFTKVNWNAYVRLRMHTYYNLVIHLLRVDCNLISEIKCLCVIYLMLNLLWGYCYAYTKSARVINI